MRPDVKGYILKEYGSWSVLTVAFILGLSVSRAYSWIAVPLFAALAVLVNSKQAFMKSMRSKEDKKASTVFLGEVAAASVTLIAIFGKDVLMLMPLLVFPAAYLFTNRFGGEHSILTELLGFTLLSLAAVLAKFLLTGGLDVRLFLGVVFYFTAGVFKIKALLLQKTSFRILIVLDVLLAVYVYFRMHIPLLVLLPLTDNLIVAATLYKVKLRTTGWIEVAKSLVFLLLFIYYY